MHLLTAGPAFAPRPAAFAVVRRAPVGLTHCIPFVATSIG